MTWRVAKSLEQLRNQINAAHPDRSKASDGTIGDAAHASRPSDHNPNTAGVVCALDITHDPAHGVDTFALADVLIAYRHPDLKYVISNRRIATASTGWKWVSYAGTDPHTNHVHVSVGVGLDGQSKPPYDDTAAWTITKPAAAPAPQPAPKPSSHPLVQYVGRNVHLAASQPTWRVYKIGSVAPRTEVATLKPSKFGGLSYRVEAVDKSLNSVIITTRDFGRVSLPIAQDSKGTLYATATIS